MRKLRLRPRGLGILLKDTRINYWQEYRKLPSMQELMMHAEERYNNR